ncbi:hypothetical protein [Comamonas piscis]
MKIALLFFPLYISSLNTYAYEPNFLGWKTDWNGRYVSKLFSKQEACNALLQNLIDTNSLNISPPLIPWSADVLLHPQDHRYYYCTFRAANNTSNDLWGNFWSRELLTEYTCSQPRSKLVYPIPNYPYAVPECVCEPPYFEKNGTCVPRGITINGPSSTMALPSELGPIAQQINVDISGSESKSFRVNVVIKESGSNVAYSISGTTDSAGTFEFMYIPPYFRSTTIELTATCSSCENTASKLISVTREGAEEPQMCRH